MRTKKHSFVYKLTQKAFDGFVNNPRRNRNGDITGVPYAKPTPQNKALAIARINAECKLLCPVTDLLIV